MAGDHRSRKHTEGGAPSRRPWLLKGAALGREQLESSSARLNSRKLKTGRRGNQMKKRRDQYGIAVPLESAIIDVRGTTPRRKRNGGTSVGYADLAALWKKQCVMTPESRNSGATEALRKRPLLGNGTVNMFPRKLT
jgi:hypothetical protein